MKCPRDQTTLEERHERALVIHQCPQCHGIWFARQHFNSLLHQETPPSILHSSSPSADDAPADCPIGPDRHRLHHRMVRGVPIDSCDRHHGFWLDGGELELLRQRVLLGQQVRPVSGGSGSDSAFLALGTADLVGGVFEVLFEILSGL